MQKRLLSAGEPSSNYIILDLVFRAVGSVGWVIGIFRVNLRYLVEVYDFKYPLNVPSQFRTNTGHQTHDKL